MEIFLKIENIYWITSDFCLYKYNHKILLDEREPNLT